MDGRINAYVNERLRLQGVEGWGEASVWKRWRCSSSHLGVQIADFKINEDVAENRPCSISTHTVLC